MTSKQKVLYKELATVGGLLIGFNIAWMKKELTLKGFAFIVGSAVAGAIVAYAINQVKTTDEQATSTQTVTT